MKTNSDVNFDGNFDVLDIVMMVGYILGSSELSENQICLGDGNGDGILDILDIMNWIGWWIIIP